MPIKFPNTIPISPGVYFFLDAKGKRLYIGKAVNLRNRLRGHPMLTKATSVDWQVCDSEIEALILESRFIKKYKPPYNISLRDDKNYSYVVFTDDEFPKVFVAHRNGIGPFTSSTELRAALKALRKIFPFCSCKKPHTRMCLNGHLKLCFGFCCLKEPTTTAEKKMYRASIRALQDVLSGKRRSILNQRMIENIKIIKEIAGRESAIEKLEKILGLKKIIRIEGYDISNIQGKFATGSMVVFENGMPNKSEYRKFKIQAPNSPNDILMLREMLERRLRHPEWQFPDVMLIDGGKGQLNAASDAIRYTLRDTLPILSIAKGKQEIFSTTLSKPLSISHLPSAVAMLLLHIDAEAHRFAITYYRKLHQRTISGTLKAL